MKKILHSLGCFIKKSWGAKLSLCTIFWLWYVLVRVVFALCFVATIIFVGMQEGHLLAFMYAALAMATIQWTLLWQNAFNVENRLWGNGARAIVVMEIAFVIWLAEFYTPVLNAE